VKVCAEDLLDVAGMELRAETSVESKGRKFCYPPSQSLTEYKY